MWGVLWRKATWDEEPGGFAVLRRVLGEGLAERVASEPGAMEAQEQLATVRAERCRLRSRQDCAGGLRSGVEAGVTG